MQKSQAYYRLSVQPIYSHIFKQASYFKLCGTLTDESEVDSNLLCPAKRQKCFPDSHTLAVQQTLDTKEIACSISTGTLKKIRKFSAFHDVIEEQMEFGGSSKRENVENKKQKHEINLFDTWDSKRDSALPCDKRDDSKQPSNVLLLRNPTKTGDCNNISNNNVTVKYTPLEQQVLELKKQHSGMILMIQTAYKYTFFGEDAEIASRVLNIMLSQHHNFPTAIIPTVRLHVHIRRLVEDGYRVGVVNQVETAAVKAAGENKNALFARELAHVYTKATLIGDDVDPLSQEGEFIQGANVACYIMCIAESSTTVSGSQQKTTNLALVAFDPSTGETIYDAFEDGPCREELEQRLEHLDPSEILVPHSLSQETERLVKYSSARVDRLEDDLFSFTGALVQVASFFCKQDGSESDSPKFCEMTDLSPLTVICLSVLIHHLKQFGLERALRSDALRSFTSNSRYLQMDATVLRNLEIFQSSVGSSKGSLFWALNHTKTKFGSRLLHEWVSQPLRDLTVLQSRQEAISELLHSESAIVHQLQEILCGIPDVDRGLTTCIHQRCGPATLYAVLQTLGKLQTDLQALSALAEQDLQSTLLQDLIKDTVELLSNIQPFIQNLNQQAARDGDKTKLLHDYSAFPSVTKRLEQILAVTQHLEDLKPGIAHTLGLLRFDYVMVSGQEFLIEVQQKQKKLVPHSWRKISETKQVIRYRTSEVDTRVRELNQLREQLVADCHSAWLSFLAEFNAHYFSHKKAIKNIAMLDVLFSLVQVAKQEGYCKPTLVDVEEVIIDIEKGRHPVISLLFSSGDQFVANGTKLKSSEECCMILSGPNMGGKSCYIRQVALIAVMAHMGSYVPAESATISILDSVFIRMGARDELFQGQSTLLLELGEASVILRKATRRSLALLDELGRGTSSCDGTAIAVATLHHLLTQVQCLTLFVTHYPVVMELERQYKGQAHNYHMAFLVHDKEDKSPEVLTFLYEVTNGSAGHSYGLNVARLANLPPRIIQHASEKARMLESLASYKCFIRQHFQQLWQSSDLKGSLKAFRLAELDHKVVMSK
ncbi:DNA mismatch repair protein Msh3-like isoform X2 [Zootermopsis nevadensis]|uniref:DNA mismatch repair protein Msh3-like isoform X2 n=1 Tax=Zootermopsis nevadensis TaxID=136037 RepID=UPI000B8EC2DC|nr:DNA mismatch repair protein Msh3-like isoform X2 [Zootermopsis nevadensis]